MHEFHNNNEKNSFFKITVHLAKLSCSSDFLNLLGYNNFVRADYMCSL